jgi:hypothetical protein
MRVTKEQYEQMKKYAMLTIERHKEIHNEDFIALIKSANEEELFQYYLLKPVIWAMKTDSGYDFVRELNYTDDNWKVAGKRFLKELRTA